MAARLSRNHGRCQIEGKPRLEDPLHAEFRLACERGAIRFDVLLSPATPPRLQNAEYTEELPSDERTDRAAKLLARAVTDPEGAFGANVFSPALERARVTKTLRRLGRVSEFDAHPPRAVDATCWQ